MATFSDQLEEIKTLISSNTRADKSFAYSTLLHLQEQSIIDHSLIQTLAETSHSLLSPILADTFDGDEEIAAQALKCLGFMIYHPSLVSVISVNDANLVAESLAKLITTTKMKSICNLGVWCISIQQFDASFLDAHFHSLLRAIIHALDNPIGSLSTTFEAIQAVMKLATQLSEKMRDSSNIWAPPIYRRLISVDKRERDMSERCLLKIKSAIFPPPVMLSKALVQDMKQRLLPGMKELLNIGMKVQTMQAWGWFIRLLGSHAMKNRHLVNELLKIPEQTFSDHDSQVQIASQVAWEGLIDSFIHPPIRAPETKTALEHGIQQAGTSKGKNSEIQDGGVSKSINLIMVPLIGIMSSKCDISVHSSCLNTWCYLLHKLDTSVNYPSVIKAVLEPIFEAVFRVGPDSTSIWLWNFCLDLLDDFILAKCREVNYDSNNQVSGHLAARTTMLGPPIIGKCLGKHYPMKWLPWDLSQLDFHIKMIHILLSQGSKATSSPENRSFAYDAALRIFRSVLKGVQIEFKKSIINYDEIMLCLKTILRFTRKICEDVTSEDTGINDLHHNSLRFIEVVTEELEFSILGSPLYKVALDLKYIDNLQSVNEIRHSKVLDLSSVTYMDMVSPMVYLTILYFCVVFQSTLNSPKAELILQATHLNLNFLLSSYDPLENLHAIIGLLYEHMGCCWLKIWTAIAKGLKDYIDGIKDLSLLKTEFDSPVNIAISHLLSYPFVVCSGPQKLLTLVKTSALELSLVSSQREPELEHVIEVWKSLYGSVSCASQFECSTSNSFSEDLCSILNKCLDKYTSMLGCGTELDSSDKNQDLDLLSLCGDTVICVLEQIVTSEVSSEGNKNKDDGDNRKSSGINSSLGFAARFMRLSWTKTGTNPPKDLLVTPRVFSALACFVGCLRLKQDILLFIEIISGPLLEWLSNIEIQEESTIHQLQLLWIEILNCLRRCWPPVIFDSSLLKLQAPLLEKALDHPNLSISEPTVTYWNSTYSEQIKLDYPQSLLHVLDKLSRNGRINLHKGSPPFLGQCHSRLEVITATQRYRVSATHNRSSKRVEFMEDTVHGLEHNDKLSPGLKRKTLELTEHQKEVRRAQQGRERDCNGHGPGIRTYTSVDFSQGNEESQESQEIRNPDSILEMLRRTG